MSVFCVIKDDLSDLICSSSDCDWDETEPACAPRETTKEKDWVAWSENKPYLWFFEETSLKLAFCILLNLSLIDVWLSIDHGRLEYLDIVVLLVTEILGLDRYYGMRSENQTIVLVLCLVSITAVYALLFRNEYLLLPYLGLQCLLAVASWLIFLCPFLFLFYNILKFVFIGSLNLFNIILPHGSPQNVYLFEYSSGAVGTIEFCLAPHLIIWKVMIIIYVLRCYFYMKFVRCTNNTRIQPVRVVEVLLV